MSLFSGKKRKSSLKHKKARVIAWSYDVKWCKIQDHSAYYCLSGNHQFSIGHFRIVLCLFFKARPRAKPFIWKWVLSSCEWKLVFNWEAMHQDSLAKRGTRQLGNGLLGYATIQTLWTLHFNGEGQPRQNLKWFIFFKDQTNYTLTTLGASALV